MISLTIPRQALECSLVFGRAGKRYLVKRYLVGGVARDRANAIVDAERNVD